MVIEDMKSLCTGGDGMKLVALETECLGEDISIKGFEQYGEFVAYPITMYGQIGERLKDADIAIINRCRMEKNTIEECKNLKLICITGTGMDMVDHEYIASRGIMVCNVKGYSTDSVAQHTFAMLFYLLEHMFYYDTFVKGGNYIWSKKQDYSGHRFTEIAGKTWGICGLGAIGEKVAEIATVFGCRVQYYSTSGMNTNSKYERVELEQLLKESDIISVHAPLTKESRGLFGYEEFCKMKKSAIFLNLGRGAIIDEAALACALKEERIKAAGLDVLIQEPMEVDSPLFELREYENLLITPHIAWSSREARQRVVDELCQQIKQFISKEGNNK